MIDVRHLGRERVIGCWQVDDVLIDPGPESSLEGLLEGLGDWQPRALLLTHIHLDHAGAAGALVRRWPELEVYVHEVGAPSRRLDPEKLLRSAERLYGDRMQELWGEGGAGAGGQPADAGRRRGSCRASASPTRPAMPRITSPSCTLESGPRLCRRRRRCAGTASRLFLPPTPPPDIDIEAWNASIDAVLDLASGEPLNHLPPTPPTIPERAHMEAMRGRS